MCDIDRGCDLNDWWRLVFYAISLNIYFRHVVPCLNDKTTTVEFVMVWVINILLYSVDSSVDYEYRIGLENMDAAY